MKPIYLPDTVMVLGAGLSGTLAAREIGKYHKVLLIEQANEITPETSSRFAKCYKLHLGLHYTGDEKTAVQCLKCSIEFAREFFSCILGIPNDPWRRGQHFFMSNSLIQPEIIKQVIDVLKKTYEKLIMFNPQNQVFGDPKDFIRYLDENDYPYVAKKLPFYDMKRVHHKINVLFAIETNESQINIHKLKEFLKQQITLNKNITFLPNTTAMYGTPLSKKLTYTVMLN